MKVEAHFSKGTKGIKEERGGQRKGSWGETEPGSGYLTNIQRKVNFCDPRSFRCHKLDLDPWLAHEAS